MPNYPYKTIGLPLDLENWEQLNTNFDQIATDIKNISGDVLAELIHKANLEYKAPVATFADLTTTYPNAKEGWAVQTLDDNKIYRFNGSNWVFVQQFGAGPFSDIYNRLDNLGLDATAFGAVGDGETDDSDAIQAAIDMSSANGGGIVRLPPGVFIIAQTLTLQSRVKLIGAGRRVTTIQKAAGFLGDAIKSVDFDTLTGTTIDGKTAPSHFAIKELTLDGQYMFEDTASERFISYINNTGGGIKFYGREFDLDCEVINMAGVGVWLECNYTEGSPTFETKDYDLHLEIRDCKEECFVLKGLADGRIHQLWTRGGGRRIYPDQDAMPPLSSPTYSGSGYTSTDNIVFDNAGAEIGMIHSWGAYSGRGLRTIGQVRLLADLIIVESCVFGGVQFNDGAYGQISNLKVHGCSGGRDGSQPDIEIDTSRLFNITSINHEARNVDTGQTAIKITGSFVNINQININKAGYPGHGIDLQGNYNHVAGIINNGSGTAPDGLASSAFMRTAPFNDRTLSADLLIVGYPVAFRSIGRAYYEKINISADLNSGQRVFVGDLKDYHTPTMWNIAANENGVQKTTRYSASLPFDPSTTNEQTLTFNHTLVGTPSLADVILTLQDTPSNLTNPVSYMLVSAVTGTTITVKVRMTTAQGSNTSPRVNILATI